LGNAVGCSSVSSHRAELVAIYAICSRTDCTMVTESEISQSIRAFKRFQYRHTVSRISTCIILILSIILLILIIYKNINKWYIVIPTVGIVLCYPLGELVSSAICRNSLRWSKYYGSWLVVEQIIKQPSSDMLARMPERSRKEAEEWIRILSSDDQMASKIQHVTK
jgi:hypothetical protein